MGKANKIYKRLFGATIVMASIICSAAYADESPQISGKDIQPIPFSQFEKFTDDWKAQVAASEYAVEHFPPGSNTQDFVADFKASGGTCALDLGLQNPPPPPAIVRYECIVKAGARWTWPWQWFSQPGITSWQGTAYVEKTMLDKIIKLELTPNFSDF